MVKIDAKLWEPFCEEFDKNIFSLTKFTHRRRQILSRITSGKVLNLGTGSTTYLNRALINQENIVIATDYCKKMLDVAKKRFQHKNLKYVLSDSRNLKFKNETFDSVIAVNSILPEKRSCVKKMFKEVYRVLKPKGKFVAFLTAFDSAQKAVKELGLQLKIDEKRRRVYDTTGWQCFHDYSTIGKELRYAGFENYHYEKVYLDSEEEKREIKRLYGVNTEDSPLHEYLVVARKY